jgi:hypothetical protein
VTRRSSVRVRATATSKALEEALETFENLKTETRTKNAELAERARKAELRYEAAVEAAEAFDALSVEEL